MTERLDITVTNIRDAELEDIKKLSIQELAVLQKGVQNEIDKRKAETTEFQKRFDFIRNVALPEAMEANGVENVKIADVGKVTLTSMMNVSIPKDNRIAFYDWLRANGHGDIIQEQTNASTVKALIKEQMSNGEPIPEDLVNINAFTQARITKG